MLTISCGKARFLPNYPLPYSADGLILPVNQSVPTCMSHKYSTQLFNYMAKLGGFALAALLVLPGLSLAQVTTYTFSQTQGTYTPIATPDETYGTENTDDTNFPGVDLGFSFDYNGQTYTEVGLNANGIVVFGPNSSWGYTAISPNTQTNDGIVFTSAGPAGQSNLLAPFAF